MRTRRGVCYPDVDDCRQMMKTVFIRKRRCDSRDEIDFTGHKRRRTGSDKCFRTDYFDSLPDDLVISVLCKLSSSAERPADILNVLSTCKRLNELGLNLLVLSKASPKAFEVRASNWSDSAHRFLKNCAESGNIAASYTLGMIRFYCLQNRGGGASLMAKAAIRSYAPALYSLAVIQFNGSGGSKSDKDLRAGVALCGRAAFLGHVDALREFGHCLQDGYGVRQNIAEGRRFLIQANARELFGAVSAPPSPAPGSLVSWNPPEPHPANRFLSEWFGERGGCPGEGLRMCSNEGCGRPETRKHEFRRCSVCGVVNYCSRACQALDWKLRHRVECVPVDRWIEEEGDGDVADGVNDAMDES
uniref:MYND-type domain-containing protein n=1 Tax=Kalanchoe fedtschenkoi TaxID=63787 RepID=A0A7N0UXA5_KALFE